MTRKQFIKSCGATSNNNWRGWSFINKPKRVIIFGAIAWNTKGGKTRILDERWKKKNGRKNPLYKGAREHVRLIEEEGFQLMTFPMELAENEDGAQYIKRITPELSEKMLVKDGSAWFAMDPSAKMPLLAEELVAPKKYPEGACLRIMVNAYERNPKARKKCVEYHGCTCSVCEFDFSDAYGGLGEGFIHVHHIIPIGKIGKQYEVDPIADLIPVCPNCHVMIHRREPPLTVEQLRKYIQACH